MRVFFANILILVGGAILASGIFIFTSYVLLKEEYIFTPCTLEVCNDSLCPVINTTYAWCHSLTIIPTNFTEVTQCMISTTDCTLSIAMFSVPDIYIVSIILVSIAGMLVGIAVALLLPSGCIHIPPLESMLHRVPSSEEVLVLHSV